MKNLFGTLLLLIASHGWSDVVFMGVGKDGEASFSGEAQNGFVPLHIEVAPEDDAEAATTRRRTAEIAKVAAEMAELREARTAARTPSPTYQINYQPQQYEPEVRRYYYPLVNQYRHRRAPAVAPPPPRPPRKTFEPAFYPRSVK